LAVRFINMSTNSNVFEMKQVSFSYDLSGVRSLRSFFLEKNLHSKKVTIFNDLELVLKQGQRLALIGPNGCGKSTFCALLAGHYKETKGTIKRSGKVRSYLHGHAKLYDDLSVKKYLDLFLFLLWPDVEAQKLIEERFSILDLCMLKENAAHPIKVLSVGMLAKLHLCAYTSFANDTLIIDEGLSSLEFPFHKILKKRLERSLGTRGLLIIVEHQKDLLRLYCDKAITLEQGTIEVGPLD
jgi:ABC-type polysaccharide/polyol phosphate transport system ATPase subunit